MLLLLAAFATRFWHLENPANVFFDETYFGLFAEKYLTGQYYFDIHPPLGKLILAAAASLGAATTHFSFDIGKAYPDAAYVRMRMTTALFGSLLVVLVYF